ncbi:MAG: prohead protease/major capsid protein fusion protein [Pseudomonadota bacterium]
MSERILHRRSAAIGPSSLDRSSRTVEAVASTGSDVKRRDGRGPYTERLSVSEIDAAGLTGTPVLNAHRQHSISDAIGVIEAARIEQDRLIVRIRIARGDDGDRALDLMEDGALRGVSLGYRPTNARESEEAGSRIITITPEIVEVSLVPVPADPGAKLRSSPMPEPIQPENPAAPPPENITRAAVNAEIRSIAAISNLGRDWADQQIDAGANADQARAAAFEAMQANPPAIRAHHIGDTETSDQYIERRAEALFARATPSHELSEPARRFAYESMVDIAKDTLLRANHQVTGLSPAEVVKRALHTTSDFPLILGESVNRGLRQAYNAAPSGLKTVARQVTAPDFRARHRIQLSEAPTLEKVVQNGEYKRGTMGEASESFGLETFGRIVGLTRQAIINDDLGAFSNLSTRIGTAAASFEAAQLATLLESNPTLNTGHQLFSAEHGNLAAGPQESQPDQASLDSARTSMRRKTGLAGDLIDVTPRFLVVPPELETTSEALLTEIMAHRIEDVNVFSALTLVVEPRLQDTGAWYVCADPALIDGLEYAYLEGAPGPQVETRQGFDVDGVEIKVRLDFGAGFVEHRGFYKNPGATT